MSKGLDADLIIVSLPVSCCNEGYCTAWLRSSEARCWAGGDRESRFGSGVSEIGRRPVDPSSNEPKYGTDWPCKKSESERSTISRIADSFRRPGGSAY
jgi:hypothetical protein